MSLQQFGKGALRVAKNYTLRFTDTQTKVRDATSNALWGPSGTQMNYIAQLSFNQNDFIEIMEMLDKRLNDKGKNWRHVFKSLIVLDYLLHAGSENVVIYFRDNLYIIKALKEFQYVDEDGKDCGANVRERAKDVSDLLSDTDRLREVRRNRAPTRDRTIRGHPGTEEDEEDESLTTQPRRNRATERDDDELERTIEASKQSLAEERQRGDQPSTPAGRDNKPSDSSEEKSGPLRSATHSEDRGDDLLEVEVPSAAPAVEFNFDEPPSPGSSAHREDEVPPHGAPHAIARLSDAIPAIYPPSGHAEDHLDTVESSQGVSKFKKWLQTRTKKGSKDLASHKPGRASRTSRRPADRRSPSQSPARLDPINGGPSWMAAGKRVPRMVATSPEEPSTASSSGLYARIRQALQPKSPTEDAHASHPNEDASCTGQGSVNPQEVGPAQQANDAPHPSGGIYLTRKSGKATLRLSMTFPGWMCCGSGTEDEMHSSG